MGPWRLELIRIWRTRRWLALMATFVLLGLANPVAAYYLPQLAKITARGPKVTVATSTAANSISMVVNSLAQLGTLVVVVVAAVTLAVDARPGLAAFYRTRLRHPVLLLLPRYVTTTGVTLVALALGMLAAWYETTALLGAVSFRSLLAALALQAVWFCFVTSVVAFFTSTVPGAIGSSIAVLLGLVALGAIFQRESSWLPNHLMAVAQHITVQPADGIWRSAAVAGVASLVALVVGVNRIGKRELYPAGDTRVRTRSSTKVGAHNERT